MGISKIHVTTQVLKVLGPFISDPGAELSGAAIARMTKLQSGTLYPILMRLEQAKWLQSEWEAGNPREMGRPRRRLYTITGLGARSARTEFRIVTAAIGEVAWNSL
jgi:PadR family transcriptional regulator, regulatory protein PadR